MYDLIVIGGGPAGTSAAITAASKGAKILLLERGRFPRHKVCGEFVSAESLGLLSTLLSSKDANLLNKALRITEARVFLDGRILRAPVNPPAASIARLDLDAALWRCATQAGVEARDRSTVVSISGHGPFTIATASGEFQSRAAINTAGRWSFLTTAQPSAEKWLGVKAHFVEPHPPRSVDLYFFDGGYCGVQPVELDGASSGRINACAMVRSDVATNLTEVFALHPALLERSRKWQFASDPVSTSPLIFHQPEPVRGNLLQAGDAAAFVDPFVGDGISLALRGGALAAGCLVPFFREEISLASAAARYRADYESKLGRVFRASSQVRRALRWPQSVRKPILSVMEHAPALTKFLVARTR